MSNNKNKSNIISFASAKANTDSSKYIIISQQYNTMDVSNIYFHPSFDSLLGLDKEPDSIINVDPTQEPNFNFNGGEKWSVSSSDFDGYVTSNPIRIGEKFHISSLLLLKELFGHLLTRCKFEKYVIEVELTCNPKLSTESEAYVFCFDVKVNGAYLECIEEKNSLPEFWFSYSQCMHDYLFENYKQAIQNEEAFTLNLRYNDSGLFWELENPLSAIF